MQYRIFTDMAADISKEYADAHDISFVPMEFTVGDALHTSTEPESPEFLKTFYDGQRRGDLTQTTQITPFNYREYFKPWMKDGISALYICLSSGLSSTFQSALVAADDLKDRFPDADLVVVDSLSATGGMNIVIEHAVRNLEAGMDLQENAADLRAFIPRLDIKFMVQDLTYLHRGGRVSAATMLVANTLNIKPILEINREGKLVTINKKHGNKQALNTLLDYFDATRDPETEEAIYIIHSDAPDLASYLYDEVKKLYPDKEVKISALSPVIGAHTGPGLAAVCHAVK